jgi:hypothetical protein
MKKRLICSLSALALLFACSAAARADLFSQIETSPNTYWVPDPTPGPAYASQPPPGYYGAGGPPPGYYGPPPGYYGPPGPPPPPVVVFPRFFIGFHFH